MDRPVSRRKVVRRSVPSRDATERLAQKPPRARLLVDERRAQLLSLGLQLFGERSYDEVSIDELAREAQISKGLLYHYFPTKRDLYVAGLQATDEGKAKEAWGKLIDLIADEIPLYPLFPRKTPTAYDKASLVDFKPIPLTGLSFVGVASTK